MGILIGYSGHLVDVEAILTTSVTGDSSR